MVFMVFAFLGRLICNANHTQPDRHSNIDTTEVKNEVAMYMGDYNVVRQNILGYLGEVENLHLSYSL